MIKENTWNSNPRTREGHKKKITYQLDYVTIVCSRPRTLNKKLNSCPCCNIIVEILHVT